MILVKVMNTTQERDTRFDAFVSYSRADIDFARKLEEAIERFLVPKGIGSRKRRLDVFRDESDMIGADYFESITE